ncbi:class I SAM-dependent methyltransferase [Planctomycetota bacterium]
MTQPLLSEISRRRKLKLLKDHLPAGASVMEVGTGSGWFAERLRESGYAVTTLDLVPPANIVGDVNRWRQLGIPPHSFDAVIALEVIEHVDCLPALRSICKPGGLIMLSSPHPSWDWVMKTLELLHLTQKRTSEHVHLTDFNDIAMPAVVQKRPIFIHQVAIFKNEGLASTSCAPMDGRPSGRPDSGVHAGNTQDSPAPSCDEDSRRETGIPLVELDSSIPSTEISRLG